MSVKPPKNATEVLEVRGNTSALGVVCAYGYYFDLLKSFARK